MMVVLHASTVVVENNALLMVQEGKPQSHGKWNLPGGHVELGEDVVRAAERETREETGLHVQARELLGIYTGVGDNHYLHFVFTGTVSSGVLQPAQREILDCRFLPFADIDTMPNDALLNPHKLHTILQHYQQGKRHPLDILCTP